MSVEYKLSNHDAIAIFPPIAGGWIPALLLSSLEFIKISQDKQWPNQAVAFFDNTCEPGMMCGIAENWIPEWRATLAVCQHNRKKRVLAASAQLFWCFLRHGMLNLPEYCWNWDEITVLWDLKLAEVFQWIVCGKSRFIVLEVSILEEFSAIFSKNT